MGARLYNPSTSRFLSTDPVYGGSANPYDYCNGDSVNCTDLSGKYSCRFHSWWQNDSHKWGQAICHVSDRDINTDWVALLGIIGAGLGALIGGVGGAVIGALIGYGVTWAYNRACTHHRGMIFYAEVRAHKVWRFSYPDRSGWWFACM
jgi:hypothetical protein